MKENTEQNLKNNDELSLLIAEAVGADLLIHVDRCEWPVFGKSNNQRRSTMIRHLSKIRSTLI